jgi:DNA-binding response OmpR family regulator
MEGSQPPTILVLEDSVIVAMDIEFELEERGYRPVSAGSIAAATSRIDERSPEEPPVVAARLDLHLPDGNSLEFAQTLHERGILVAVVSGSEADQIPAGYDYAAHFIKPVAAKHLVDWLDARLAGTMEPRPNMLPSTSGTSPEA